LFLIGLEQKAFSLHFCNQGCIKCSTSPRNGADTLEATGLFMGSGRKVQETRLLSGNYIFLIIRGMQWNKT
jgi:hypothetical protein